MEYNILNGPIRLRISTPMKLIIEYIYSSHRFPDISHLELCDFEGLQETIETRYFDTKYTEIVSYYENQLRNKIAERSD